MKYEAESVLACLSRCNHPCQARRQASRCRGTMLLKRFSIWSPTPPWQSATLTVYKYNIQLYLYTMHVFHVLHYTLYIMIYKLQVGHGLVSDAGEFSSVFSPFAGVFRHFACLRCRELLDILSTGQFLRWISIDNCKTIPRFQDWASHVYSSWWRGSSDFFSSPCQVRSSNCVPAMTSSSYSSLYSYLRITLENSLPQHQSCAWRATLFLKATTTIHGLLQYNYNVWNYPAPPTLPTYRARGVLHCSSSPP